MYRPFDGGADDPLFLLHTWPTDPRHAAVA
jgi:hypothetical protein